MTWTNSRSKVEGKAASAIKGFSDVGTNFKLAWEKLERDFGDEKAIKKSHVKAIKNLSLPDVTTPSLRNFLNNLEINIERLKALGKVVDNDDSLWDDVEAYYNYGF